MNRSDCLIEEIEDLFNEEIKFPSKASGVAYSSIENNPQHREMFSSLNKHSTSKESSGNFDYHKIGKHRFTVDRTDKSISAKPPAMKHLQQLHAQDFGH